MRRRKRIKRSIPVRREYQDKRFCLQEAEWLLHNGVVRGMSAEQIAQEIFFHASVYYFCKRTGKFRMFKEHAGIIDLRDGGDTPLRQKAYAACWLLKRGKYVKRRRRSGRKQRRGERRR